ncbi:MAG TPA: cupin domain-containing protein [bacterium]|nr:cupin domain-containing protein [bacterium]
MLLNADLHERVVLATPALDWVASPEPGVERRMLERNGEEVARAVSIVRYAPGSRFGRHEHGGGEELLVLDGELCDEHGRYPAGTYIRNPPGSAHAPYSEDGCTLLVRLCQMAPTEQARLVMDTRNGGWQGPPEAIRRLDLFRDEATGETVYLSRFAAGAQVPHHDHPGGEELFVLEGEIQDEHGRYPAGTWVRQPHGSAHAPFSECGAQVLVRRGHLPQ